MKTNYFTRPFTGIFLSLIMTSVSAYTQASKLGDENACLDGQYESNCYAATKSAFVDYVYLKSRPFSYQMSPDASFSILLKKNVSYVFSICTNFQAKSPMELKLYNDKNELLLTKTDDKIPFQPEKSGKYYITASLGKNRNNCCLILCGMLNKSIPSTPVKTKK